MTRVRKKISRKKRLRIYRRDKWVCQICMRPVNGRLKRNHPMSPTLDHITPFSLGGSDDFSNLRLAHNWCNVRRDVDETFKEETT